MDLEMETSSSVLVQMCNEDGDLSGPPFDVPLSITSKQLQLLCNSMLENVNCLSKNKLTKCTDLKTHSM